MIKNFDHTVMWRRGKYRLSLKILRFTQDDTNPSCWAERNILWCIKFLRYTQNDVNLSCWAIAKHLKILHFVQNDELIFNSIFNSFLYKKWKKAETLSQEILGNSRFSCWLSVEFYGILNHELQKRKSQCPFSNRVNISFQRETLKVLWQSRERRSFQILRNWVFSIKGR